MNKTVNVYRSKYQVIALVLPTIFCLFKHEKECCTKDRLSCGPGATAQHAHALRQHWSSIENHFTHYIILCKYKPFQDWAKHILNSCTEAVNPDSAPEYHQTSGSRQLNSVS